MFSLFTSDESKGEVMATMDKHSVFKYIEQGMAEDVKKTLTERLVREMMDKVENQVRVKVRSIVDEIVFEGVRNINDAMSMRDEVTMFIQWNQEPTRSKVGGER